jgi:hypothetical protein
MSLYRRGGVWWYDFQILGIRIRQSTGLKSRSAASQAEALHKAFLLQNPDQAELNEPSP